MMQSSEAESWADVLTRETFVRTVEVYDELGSTNDRGMVLAGDPNVERPALILAHRQTAGRGRGKNQWWASDGALTFTLVITPDRDRLSVARLPEFSLTAGVATCAALRAIVPTAEVRLKWPNDVYVDGRKICGILIEVPALSRGDVVVGVGLNVNNRAVTAPSELAAKVISIRDVTDETHQRKDVLIAVLQSLEDHLTLLYDDPYRMRQRWREFDLLAGLCVTIGDEHETVTGTCEGIDDDGSLVLRTTAGPRRFYGGVVQEFFS